MNLLFNIFVSDDVISLTLGLFNYILKNEVTQNTTVSKILLCTYMKSLHESDIIFFLQ